jgi:molybdopterin molybdotransferase
MIPEGADAMVMVEYSEAFGENNIAIYESVAPGNHVALIGEDAERGSVLLRRGTKIRPPELGVLAAAGITELPVFAPLKLTLISTGDELVSPDRNPEPGSIRDINTYALQALAVREGYRITAAHVLPDDEKILEEKVREAMGASDVIAISGGSSQGEQDITAAVITRVSKPGLLTHGIALKPGKPAILGYDRETETILIGLPGHPVSAIMVFELLLSWLWKKISGQKESFPIPAAISCNMAGSPGKTTCQPVTMVRSGDGYIAEPIFGKSGMISTLSRADGFIMIDMNKEGLKKGETVLVHLI